MKKFSYVKVQPDSGAVSAVSFIFKVYKHKDGFYYKTFLTKSSADENWNIFNNGRSFKFDETEYKFHSVSWMDREEIFAVLL